MSPNRALLWFFLTLFASPSIGWDDGGGDAW
jgi:hypothetical protein